MSTGQPNPATPAVPGLVVAAPSSGSGKTTFTLGLLRALARGSRARHPLRVGSLKIGPDYIDPGYHAAASQRPCHNLDAWAMRTTTCAGAVAVASSDVDLVIAEGVMGLFDGAVSGNGSTADVAAWLRWPVVLVVDASGMSNSAAALVEGFRNHRKDVNVAAVVFNRVGSQRHAGMLREACAATGVPVLGAIGRIDDLALPSRHLGLHQAEEHPQLDAFIEATAAGVETGCDLAALAKLARPPAPTLPDPAAIPARLPPLGQRIAVARDAAFGFCYPALLDSWRRDGASLSFFSPLADESPADDADAVYLPGGYPELHAQRLSFSRQFLPGLRRAAYRGAVVYGECGGYMVLGQTMIDADGATRPMAGLLPLETSFAERRLTLGYRALELTADTPFGEKGTQLLGHEFHQATVISERGEHRWMRAENASGAAIGPGGLRNGKVFGSFVHLVDVAR